MKMPTLTVEVTFRRRGIEILRNLMDYAAKSSDKRLAMLLMRLTRHVELVETIKERRKMVIARRTPTGRAKKDRRHRR